MIHSANKYFSRTLCVTDPVLANSLTSRSIGSGWGGGRGIHKIKCHVSWLWYISEGRKEAGQGRAGMLFQTGRARETLRSCHHLGDERAILWSETRLFQVEGTQITKASGGSRLVVSEERQGRPTRLAWSEGGVGREQRGVHPPSPLLGIQFLPKEWESRGSMEPNVHYERTNLSTGQSRGREQEPEKISETLFRQLRMVLYLGWWEVVNENPALGGLVSIEARLGWWLMVLVTQLYPMFCNPMDCSPWGSSVHGILQVRILEWVAISFSRGSSLSQSVQLLSCVQLLVTPWTAAHQASLSIISSWSLLKLMSIASVMPSNHLILCRSFLFPPSIFPSIRVFSNELVLQNRWLKDWSFSFSISPSNEHPRLISFRMDWFDFLAVQGTLKSLLQHHSSKASILWHGAYFIVQLSHPYMTTGKKL